MTTQSIDFQSLCQHLLGIAQDGRKIVAITGSPASGKSTISRQLESHLNQRHPGIAAVVEMDGFHFDNSVLEDTGRLERKGAPDTFDVDGLYYLLHRLHQNFDPFIAVPVFDRPLDISLAGAYLISKKVSLIIVEGNYLLLDYPKWRKISQQFDLTVLIDVPKEIILRRLQERWRSDGYSEAQVAKKVEDNDLPNSRLVIENSVPADYVMSGAVIQK